MIRLSWRHGEFAIQIVELQELSKLVDGAKCQEESILDIYTFQDDLPIVKEASLDVEDLSEGDQ